MAVYNIIGICLVFWGHSLWCFNLYNNKFNKLLSECIYLSIAVLSALFCICFCIIDGGNVYQKIKILFSIAFIIVSTSFFLLSKGYFFKKLFLYITYATFFCVIYSLSYLIVGRFFSSDEESYYLMGIAIRTLLHICALIPYICWVKDKILKVRVYDKKQWIPLCAVSVLLFCLQSVWMTVGKSVWNYHSYDIVIFLLLLIVTVGLYVVMIYTINYMNKCAENNQVKMHSQFLLDQIKNYERSEEKNSQFRHDVRHHMLHLASLIDSNNLNAALDYIEEYDKAVLSLSKKRYCQNPVINNIISSYATRFQEKNIPFSVKCPIKDDLQMKDIDIVSMLGNILENALHASEKSINENKTVGLYFAANNNQFVIVCENTCDDDLELVDGIPKNKSIGILSILNVCEIYNGHASYKIENGICSVCIVLPLQ